MSKKWQIHKATCPYCDGTGIILQKSPYKPITLAQREKMFKLRQKGMTLREIGQEVGIEHPQRVKHYVQSYATYLIENDIANQ